MSGETTELKTLSKLKKAGKLRYWRGTIEIPESELHAICDEIQAEHEQAIAATLESDGEYEARMDALLCRLTNGKWSKSRAYSLDFMVSCVDEEYEDAYEKERADLGSGTLTAEQVREAIMSADRWEKPMGNTGLTNTHLIIRDDGWQAIADELNAELGSGTCEWVLEHSGTLYDKWRCSGCGYLFVESRTDQGIKEDFEPNFCPRCGAKIRKAVGR